RLPGSKDKTRERACLSVLERLIEKFNVRPGFSFYDDFDDMNAMADPIARLPDGPDGTIMFGVNLLRAEAIRFSGNRPTPLVTDVGVHVIIAHEFAHILQYKKGLSPNGSWHMEPHADYMAGWFIGSTFDRARDPSQSDVDVAARSMFTMGDWAFNKP